MPRALRYDIPGPDWRVAPDIVRERGWPAIFGDALDSPRSPVVDIGFGRGEFLMNLAEHAPTTAHIGIEYSFKRVLKMTRRLARSELKNVRLLDCPAEVAMEELFQPGSVSCIWVNYPDPWPKKRHFRRRLLQPEVVGRLADRLERGGVLNVATDHVEYAEFIDSVLSAEVRLENIYDPVPFRSEVEGRLPTAYEREWRAEGRNLHYFSYRRK